MSDNMTDLEKAKRLLSSEGYTCVLCRGEDVLSSHERGVKPLLELIDTGRCVTDFSGADKVVGKAAAYLYVLLGVTKLYAGVISGHALDVLAKHGIYCEYGQLVPAIRSRDNRGFCPMESCVIGIDNPQEALLAIREKLIQLNK